MCSVQSVISFNCNGISLGIIVSSKESNSTALWLWAFPSSIGPSVCLSAHVCLSIRARVLGWRSIETRDLKQRLNDKHELYSHMSHELYNSTMWSPNNMMV